MADPSANSTAAQRLKALPSIEKMLSRPLAAEFAEQLGRTCVRDLLREIIDEVRLEMRDNGTGTGASSGAFESVELAPGSAGTSRSAESPVSSPAPLLAEIEGRLARRARRIASPSLRRVVNATGVILHTNLGRAPLAAEAVDAVSSAAAHYSNLEYDVERGERGKRESHCQELLARLVGSEAATVANNNAAAVLLVLNTLAEGGEVVVSRGELIEIGGSFRIPDVMEKSGARLREVGTTNRTRIADYERAINENTRLLLRVHPSNYRIIGFTERPSLAELVDLSRRSGVPVFEDLGSGCLVDLKTYGIKDEPLVADSLRAGVSIVTFSGDKLLGGPQAGIIAGSRSLLDRVLKNPLMRAVRVDKMTYAALEATLRLYERGAAKERVPVIRALAATLEELRLRAQRFCESIRQTSSGKLQAATEAGESVIGGGSAPEVKLPTVLVAIRAHDLTAASIEKRMRACQTPIITRTENDRLLIDLRTVALEEEAIILEALQHLNAGE